MVRSLSLLLGAAIAVAWVAPAAAQSRAQLDSRLRVVEGVLAEQQQKLSTIEGAVVTGDPAAVRLQSRIDALEGELRRMTGALEESRYLNDRLMQELATMRRELQLAGVLEDGALAFSPAGDSRPLGLGPTGFEEPLQAPAGVSDGADAGGAPAAGAFGVGDPAPASASTPSAAGPIDLPAEPGAALDLAKSLLFSGDFGAAEQGLSQFVDTFPDAPQLGEAYFWLGETYFVRGAFGEARDAYIESIRRDPTGMRAPDAMVKLASALHRMGHDEQACTTLNSFPRQYPDATLAVQQKARQARELAGCR